MLRKTHPALFTAEDLIDAGLRKYAMVVTEDADELGVALRLHLRPLEDVDPDLKLYAAYVEMQTVQLGGTAFIPLEFVDQFDPAEQRLHLEVKLSKVKDEVWNRKPDFVARGHSTKIELPNDVP